MITYRPPSAGWETLAGRCRRARADPGSATLLVRGLPAGAPMRNTLLYDAGGRPTFICARDSKLARAAERTGIGLLILEEHGRLSAQHTVAVAGQLRLQTSEPVDGERMALVTLEPAIVLIDQNEPPDERDRYHIPLEDYFGARTARSASGVRIGREVGYAPGWPDAAS